MHKIKAPHDDKSRIVCVTGDGRHDFYYQPAGTKKRYWLARCPFDGSIFAYFRDKGRNMNDLGFSLTIRQLYRFRDYRRKKLARQITRLPQQVDYVIREMIACPRVAVPARSRRSSAVRDYEPAA